MLLPSFRAIKIDDETAMSSLTDEDIVALMEQITKVIDKCVKAELKKKPKFIKKRKNIVWKVMQDCTLLQDIHDNEELETETGVEE